MLIKKTILIFITVSFFSFTGAGELLLKKDDRLVMTGDSITSPMMYTKMIDAYITACYPQLNITCIQNGIYGENTNGFIKRITGSCINKYHPTVATTCYGMNDGRKGALGKSLEETKLKYEENVRKIIKIFNDADCRVIIGSPGIVRIPDKGYNSVLNELKNICKKIAKEKKCGFVDIHSAMKDALKKFNERKLEKQKVIDAVAILTKSYKRDKFCLTKDGIHPNWPGHLVMAAAFLKKFGFDGDLANIEWDIVSKKVSADKSHTFLNPEGSELVITSTRYPFTFSNSGAPGFRIMPVMAETISMFNDLNRFMLKIKVKEAGKYKLRWQGWSKKQQRWGGRAQKVFDSNELSDGINLIKEFPCNNPFTTKHNELWRAITLKFRMQAAIQINAFTKKIPSFIHDYKSLLNVRFPGENYEDYLKEFEET